MKKLTLLVLFGGLGLVFGQQTSQAANHYIRQAATGTGAGVDWTNACTGLTGACAPTTRGDVYYVATGTYPGFTFSTALSGTTLIVIKGATAADHGTATGWLASYGVDVTQAQFTSAISIGNSTGYVTIDGNYGNPAVSNANMGFAILLSGDCGGSVDLNQIFGTPAPSNVTYSHFALLSCTGDYERIAFWETTDTSYRPQRVTLSYIRFDGWQVAVYTHDDFEIFDHNYMVNPYDSPTHHGNLVDIIDGSTHMTISNNYWSSCFGTTCVGPNDTGSNCSVGLQNSAIFGNVLQGDQAANGVIASTTRCFMATTQIYNNTIYNNQVSWLQVCFAGGNCGLATGNTAENNLIYSSVCGLNINGGTHDYNTYSSCTDGTPPSESHGQDTSTNFLVNASGGNFSLASDTAAWNPSGFPSGDNLDIDGVTRTSSRGAYQFTGSSVSTPQPPTGLIATVTVN